MRTLYILFSVVIISAIAASCIRENEFVPAPPKLPGVKSDSGRNILRVTPRHHLNENIDSGVVYIAYDHAVPTGSFNDIKAVELKDGKRAAIFDSLEPGDYYLYATGIDRDLDTLVRGGANFRIVPDTTPGKRTYDLYLDVTEGPHTN